MNTRIFLTACIALLPLPVVHADIYRWVDSAGVTHFADARPAPGTTQVAAQAVNIQQDYTESNPDADYYSIVNQSRRLQAQRAEKDNLALQKEQLRLEWYRAKQEGRIAELAAAARLAETRQPLILLASPYINRPRPIHWTTPTVEPPAAPMHLMNNLGVRPQPRPVKDVPLSVGDMPDTHE